MKLTALLIPLLAYSPAAAAYVVHPPLQCGGVRVSASALVTQYVFASPGDLLNTHDVRYEQESTVNYAWRCPLTRPMPPVLGFKGEGGTTVLEINNVQSSAGTVVVRGRGAITLANPQTPNFSAGVRCDCDFSYEIVKTTFSLNGIAQLRAEADKHGELITLKLKEYKLQKTVLELMQESSERLREIRANLDPNDPFDFVVIQKIDEILAGQDVGVTPEAHAALHDEIIQHLYDLGRLRDLLVETYEQVQGELQQTAAQAIRALNKVISDGNRQLGSAR